MKMPITQKLFLLVVEVEMSCTQQNGIIGANFQKLFQHFFAISTKILKLLENIFDIIDSDSQNV